MFISKKQYLRQSKNLKLSLLCQQKLLSVEGPKGLITYPLYAEFEYSKIEKKLFLTQTFNDERKKAFFQMYQILLTQSALGVLLGLSLIHISEPTRRS